MWTVILIALSIIVVIGIIRISVNKPESFWEGFFEVFCLDLLGDIIIAIIESYDGH